MISIVAGAIWLKLLTMVVGVIERFLAEKISTNIYRDSMRRHEYPLEREVVSKVAVI